VSILPTHSPDQGSCRTFRDKTPAAETPDGVPSWSCNSSRSRGQQAVIPSLPREAGDFQFALFDRAVVTSAVLAGSTA
jgi:hypothetical protein